MTGPLSGMTVIEFSAFVAAPLGGMSLAQLGADVIRIDPVGGNMDQTRWPLAPSGRSLYWTSLNKGKQSVELAINTPEGQQVACDLIASSGARGGIVLTNLPARGWLTYENLRKVRTDIIFARLTGNFDGSSAVDFTVNCASGLPDVTGFDSQPVNHVLPAWDVVAGLYLALGLVAAERHRAATGEGQELKLALSDAMLATLGNLGYLADVELNGHARSADGNHVYGAFGRDFTTADGRRLMVVAISNKQWNALKSAVDLDIEIAGASARTGQDLNTEGGRYAARHAICEVLEPWFASRTLAAAGAILDEAGVLWGPYRDFGQLLREDLRCSTENPLFSLVASPGLGELLTPRFPLSFGQSPSRQAAASPRLGEHTVEILSDRLGLSEAQIERLQEQELVGGRQPTPHA